MNADPSPSEVERFRHIVRHRLGLDCEVRGGKPLAEVLRRRVAAYGAGPDAYLDALDDDGAPREELRLLAQDLTVTETCFFRDPAQIGALRNVALPDRAKARADLRSLRLLSAGCASGEEAYTLAACVREMPAFAGWQILIDGIDINRAMLRKAQAGRYTAWSLRQTPPATRDRLFRTERQEFILDPALRAMVRFEERNLVANDAFFWRPGSFDIIFCRNVLMYFPTETMRAVVAQLRRSLAPGGFLFLGHAETLRGISDAFHLRHSHGAFYYQRDDALRNPVSASPEQPFARPRVEPAAVLRCNDGWIDAIARASDRIQALSIRTVPAESVPGTIDLDEVVALLEQERFGEVRALIDALPSADRRDPEVLLLEAVLATHGGRLDAAEQACDALLARDPRNAGSHYLKALCRESAGDVAGAMDHARAAARTDPAFALPQLQLGRLARRAGDSDAARWALRQAILLLEHEEPARLVLFGGGFSRAALVSLSRAELARCEKAG